MKKDKMSGSDYMVFLIVFLFMVIVINGFLFLVADLLRDKVVNQAGIEQSGETIYSVNGFDVFVNNQAGVACWHRINQYTIAISCLPINETRMEDSEPKQP